MNHLTTRAYDHYLTLFRIWNGGMINQLMSIEIAVGICTYFNRFGMLYESCPLTTMADYTNRNGKTSISDIVDIPDSVCFISSRECRDFNAIDAPHPEHYFVGVEDKNFSEGRNQLIIKESRDYHFDNNLANYSIVFCNRTLGLDKALSKVVFKNEYKELANRISDYIGDFSGIHLRFTDFSKKILSLSTNDINFAFEKISNNPVVIATDDRTSVKLKQHVNDGICIDSFILNEFGNDFNSLTISNEITLGLVSLLVVANSQQFIGTPKSTYSNYIHRLINQRKNGNHDWQSIGMDNPVFSGNYSWNSFQDMKISQKLWQMDWPESLLRL